MTDPRGRITVGLPVYNDPDGLRCSVPTVLGQSWQGPVRLLIVDDGSTDETPEVLHDLVQRHANIQVVTHPRNLGRPIARNRILEEAGNDYLAWIDSDDLWTPRKLELQMAALLEADPVGDKPLLCTAPFRWVYGDRNQVRVKVPDIDGDQLRNALAGSLHPYLWALLGRAQVFRDVGGFDERLPRRQDFEFFVRFLASGGEVIRTNAAMPLATYMKTDVGRSPDEIAVANEVIRRKHADTYRRYGRRFALEGRRKQHLLVARFYEHNRRPLRSTASRMRAKALDPLLWLDQPSAAPERLTASVRSLGRSTRRLVSRARSLPRRRAAAVKRNARHVVLPLRRRAVLARNLLRGDRSKETVLSLVRPRDPIAKAAARARRLARHEPVEVAVEQLRTLLGDAGSKAERDVWLALEEAYRLDAKYWSAEQALLAGLERCPGGGRLLTRHIELLSLRREWWSCVERWESLAGDAIDEVYAITHTRVARAYHHLGASDKALEVATAGLRKWPQDERLQEEYRTIWPSCVDWSASLELVHDPDVVPVGAVTSLGFLDGDEGPVTGEVSTDVSSPVDVEMLLNGTPIATTTTKVEQAEPDAPTRRTFALACDELGRYLGDGDVIELRGGRQSIRIGDDGVGVRVRSGTPSDSEELLARIAAGHRFTKFGQLRSGNTPARKRAILDLFDEVSLLLRRELGLACYPFYGNLLGAIREHDFLGHDIGGFDMGYLSGRTGPRSVGDEFIDACQLLLAHGFHLTMEPYSAMIRRRPNEDVFLDLNFAWVSDNNDLGLSYGWRHAPVTDLDRFRAPRRTALADRLIEVPGNAEAVLGQIYGDGWLVPDQAFQLEVGLQRDERYLLSSSAFEQLRAAAPDQVRLREDAEEGDG